MKGDWGPSGPSDPPWISEPDLLSIFIGFPLNSEDIQNKLWFSKMHAVHRLGLTSPLSCRGISFPATLTFVSTCNCRPGSCPSHGGFAFGFEALCLTCLLTSSMTWLSPSGWDLTNTFIWQCIWRPLMGKNLILIFILWAILVYVWAYSHKSCFSSAIIDDPGLYRQQFGRSPILVSVVFQPSISGLCNIQW